MSARIHPRPAVVNISDAARLLGTSRLTVYRMIEDGRLNRYDIGGRSPRIRIDDIEQLLGGAPVDVDPTRSAP